MPLIDNLDLFLDDFGVNCKAGDVIAKGLFDQPSEIITGDGIITTDYTLTCKSSDFSNLAYGSGIEVDNQLYNVRDVRLIDDGKFCVLSLQRVIADPLILTSNEITGGGPGDDFNSGNVYAGGGVE